MLNSSNSGAQEPLNPEGQAAEGFTSASAGAMGLGLLQNIKNSNFGNAVAGTLAPSSKGSGMRRRVRPWITDFAAPTSFGRPGDDWSVRVRTNLNYYKGNYAIIGGFFVIFSILSNPFLLVSLITLTVAWCWLLFVRPRLDDGSLSPVTVGGRTLNGFEQKVSMGFLTFVIMMLTSLGSTIFWAVGATAFTVGAHSFCHKTEFHEVEPEDFGAPGVANEA